MTKPNFTFKVIFLSIFCLLGLSSVFAQAEPRVQSEPSYEVMLQILVGSNSGEQKSGAPANLSAVTKNLRNRIPFANYNLTTTYLHRVANTGNLEIKNVTSGDMKSAAAETPVFSEWSIGQLKNSPTDAANQSAIQITNFRFGQRIPVQSANGVLNYESVGLNLQRLNVPENAPTVIGSLSSQNPSEMAFLVLTVRRAEN